MPYLSSFSIEPEKTHPFPFNIPAVLFAKQIDLSSAITFFIGDIGTGKSTLLETLAYCLQLPHLDGSGYNKSSFQAAKSLVAYLQLSWSIRRSIGFFFRAEDFGDYLNSVDRRNESLYKDLDNAFEVLSTRPKRSNFQITMTLFSRSCSSFFGVLECPHLSRH